MKFQLEEEKRREEMFLTYLIEKEGHCEKIEAEIIYRFRQNPMLNSIKVGSLECVLRY